MAKMYVEPTVTFQLTLKLNESEARALDALAGYDVEAFLNSFYANLGKSYLQPNEAGLRSLFDRARTTLRQQLERVDAAKAALSEELNKVSV